MPVPQPLLPRRTLLAAATLGALASGLTACTGTSEGGTAPSPPTVDEQARRTAADQESGLAEQARLTAQRHPTLTAAAVAAVAHQAHVDALQETLSQSAPSPSGATGPSSSPGAGQIPRDRRAAARALADAQVRAAASHRGALADPGVTGDVARLLASVAASDDAFARAVRDEGDA